VAAQTGALAAGRGGAGGGGEGAGRAGVAETGSGTEGPGRTDGHGGPVEREREERGLREREVTQGREGEKSGKKG